MLDAVAAIGAGPFSLQTLKAVQRLAAGGVADAVDPDLEARPVGWIKQVVKFFIGPLAAAPVSGGIGIVIQHPCAAGTQRAVAGDLVGAVCEPVVISADAHTLFKEPFGALQQFLIAGTAYNAQTDIHPHLQFFLLLWQM